MVAKKIEIRVIPRAKNECVITDATGKIRVRTNAAPVDGAANDSVIKLLADYFGVAKSKIKIIRGDTSRDKVIELREES